jgi:hypothetical protein
VFAALAGPAQAADNTDQPRTTFGTYGLLEMPSARMAPDGQLSAGASFFQDTQRYALNFQALPWLETSLRYSGLRNFEPALPAFYPVYWDRSFAIKARVLQEGDWLPAVAIGINDLIGTGVYSGEYVVASKRFGDVDATLGMGWGRLAGTGTLPNPFKAISHSFGNRAGLSIAGGTDFTTLFHGPNAGLFGGLVWHTPLKGLSVITEYSSDTYDLETRLGQFKPKSQINYGVNYQITSGVSLGLSWLYGRSIGGTISFQTDPTTPQYPVKLAPTPPEPRIRSMEDQQMAIDLMLGEPLPVTAPKVASSADRDAFVDRLFSGNSYSDVEIKGRDLVLTVQTAIPARPCDRMAEMVRGYGAVVDHIVFQSGQGRSRRVVQCNVPLLQTAALSGEKPVVGGKDDAAAMRAVRADAAKQDLKIEAVKFGLSEAVVYYANERYFAEDDALNRLILVLMQDAPARIEKFRIFAMNQEEFDVLRAPMERGFAQQSSAELVGNAITMMRPPLSNPVLEEAERRSYPRLSWGIFPQLRQSFFDPNNPLAVQLIAGMGATLDVTPHLSLIGEAEANLYENMPNRASGVLCI